MHYSSLHVPCWHLNWTLSDQQRRLEIPVGVAYGTEPERVIELLTEVGSKHPDIIREPPPDTLFVGFGDSALNFQLRAWTSRFERWQVIKSELTLGLNALCATRESLFHFRSGT
jgi:potassium-dependent mechanosensitive channel